MNIIVVALFNLKAWFSKRKKQFLHEAEALLSTIQKRSAKDVYIKIYKNFKNKSY